MSEETKEEKTELNGEVTAENTEAQDMLPKYKKTALLTGTFFMICFILRYIAGIVITKVHDSLTDTISYETLYIIELSISALFLQISPSVIGAFLFGRLGKNGTGIKSMYKMPKSNSRAVANFTAVYGLGQAVNLITVIVMFFFTSKADITEKISNVAEMQSAGMPGALFMFFMLIVIAPVFEEFIFRGLLMDALKPFGNGLAIIATGLMFGLYHGNFNQFFYTAAAGIAMGYIANVTGSIIPTMIIHAIMNSIGGIMNILMSTDSVQKYILGGANEAIPDADMIWVALFGIYMVCTIVLMIVGIISAVLKIKQIKRYKVPKVCPEISNGKKTAMLLLTVPSVIAIILIVDTFAGFSEPLLRSLAE